MLHPFTRNLLAAALCGAAGLASAQAWPAKTVTIVVPFPAGGTTDVLARAISTKLAAAIGQTVIVDNKPGAGATLGAALVAKAPADGHTLLMGAGHHTVATSVYKTLQYSFEKDFAPITTVALVPNVLVVSAKAPYASVKDLVAAAKANPEKLAYGSNGNGTAQHMIGTQFQIETGAKILHVPYKGSAPLTTDLLGGQVDLSFDTITPVLPFIKDGKLKALAMAGPMRSAAMPEVATFEEQGFKGLELPVWVAAYAPAGTPRPIVERLQREIAAIIRLPDVLPKLVDQGQTPLGNTPEEFAAAFADQAPRWITLIRASGVTPQ